jgi:hypothetical protein
MGVNWEMLEVNNLFCECGTDVVMPRIRASTSSYVKFS